MSGLGRARRQGQIGRRGYLLPPSGSVRSTGGVRPDPGRALRRLRAPRNAFDARTRHASAPLCRDEVVGADGCSIARAGGAGFVASWALARLGARVILHTPLAERDRDLIQLLPRETEVVIHPSRETTCFRIEVDPRDMNRRSLSLCAACDPLGPALLRGIEDSAYVLLGPLLPGDISDSLAAALREGSIPIDLGIQGLARRVDRSGRIGPAAMTGIPRLPPLRVLAGDEAEIARAAGITDVGAASRALADGVAGEVITTRGDKGASIFARGGDEPIEVPAVPVRGAAKHAIGLGDTFLAVYGWQRHLGASRSEAGSSAALAASELLVRGLDR